MDRKRNGKGEIKSAPQGVSYKSNFMRATVKWRPHIIGCVWVWVWVWKTQRIKPHREGVRGTLCNWSGVAMTTASANFSLSAAAFQSTETKIEQQQNILLNFYLDKER